MAAQTETVVFTGEEAKALQETARRRGFESVTEYLHYLVDEDANQDDEASLDEIRANLKQAFVDAFSGNVLSEEEFWKAVDSDETEG